MTRLPFVTVAVLVVAAHAALAVERGNAPQGGPGTVTLPIEDYDRLASRAARPPKRPDPPPSDAAVGSADAHIRIDGTTARATVRLEGEVFHAGTVRVPFASGATLIDARSAGRPVALVHAEGTHSALLAGPGPFSLDIELMIAVEPGTGNASLTVPALAAGSVHAVIDVPGGGTEARVAPGVLLKRNGAGGRTVVEATFEPNRATRVSWTSRDTAERTAPREARWLSDVKTLVTLGEADLRLTALVEVNVIQGEPARFDVEMPEGFDVVDVSGETLESTESAPRRLGLVLSAEARRRHQFLILLERATSNTAVQPPLLSVTSSQRETGEVAVEGAGTLELTAKESGTLKRLDVRELNPVLRSLAYHPLLAAFRYHRRPSEPPALELVVRRFPDAPVLAALAERAAVTTLVTSQGRMLTEVALTVRNHAQPFIKLGLPEGAQLLSAEVAGEKVKPVQGHDGTRVPLLRAGFRPTGPYAVSFVYVQSGSPFGKKGDAQLALARVDVPIGLVEWEVFLPDRYKIDLRGGNARPAEEVWGEVWVTTGAVGGVPGSVVGDTITGTVARELPVNGRNFEQLTLLRPGGSAGQVSGRVTDPSGGLVPGATVTARSASGVERRTRTDSNGEYVLHGVPAGHVTMTVNAPGFATAQAHDPTFGGSGAADFELRVGSLTESITIDRSFDTNEKERAEADEARRRAPSANVMNLQRRVAGVLPVDIEVPRAGTSHRFVRALVLEDETTVSFKYRAR